MARKQQGKKRAAEREAKRRATERKRQLQNIGIGVGVVALLVVAFLVFQPGPGPTGVTATESWDLPRLNGEGRVTLTDYQGKPTVAAFFASWCPHCQRELPGFYNLSTEIDDQVNWVGINTQDNGNGRGLAESSGIDNWVIARDVGGTDGRGLSTAFGARGMPLTVIYDEDGLVVDVTRGPMTAGQLLEKLEAFFQLTANN